MQNLILTLYLMPLLLIYAWYWWRRRAKESRYRATLEDSLAAGLIEPASLHPVIDASQCIGCGACVSACPQMPEHQVLGVIDGKAQLVGPTDCIGHGACKTACPTQAIELVLGTETRGVDIPMLTPSFETNVPGIYIAGELGGMGLIRNAITQGRQAVESIAKAQRRVPGRPDVLIIGAGPSGFAAALTAKSIGLTHLVLEQESLGGCVFQYPRAKLVMTHPVELPLVGRMHFKTVSKEQLLEFWVKACEQQQLNIKTLQHVTKIEPDAQGFVVRTENAAYPASTVLLTIGRRGTPRKLGVAGEELPKVVYRLIDPEQYRGLQVLVVGGGDSALEAAASIAEVPDSYVTLSYRGDAFTRAKPRNRQRVADATSAGKLQVLLGSVVKSIRPEWVQLLHDKRELTLPNDAVIVNAGGVLPNDFLRSIGIEVETKYGTL
ncbi:MAG: NAD(P)-binding domain-containing protein [Steroidobacterales bacterium]